MSAADENARVTVPLVMLPGNMGILLENRLTVQGISLKWSEEYPNAVVIVLHGADQEQAKELGFQFQQPS